MKVTIPPNETARLEALRRYRLLDSDPEQAYDDLSALAAYLCQTPIATISLVGSDRTWFKARHGLDVSEIPRDYGFCSVAILSKEPTVVPDVLLDDRFNNSPLATDGPKLRFYAAAPIINHDGFALGTVTVADLITKEISPEQITALVRLARQASLLIETRLVADALAAAHEDVRNLSRLVPICSWCRQLRNDEGYWRRVEVFLKEDKGIIATHSICPSCTQEHFAEFTQESLLSTQSDPDEPPTSPINSLSSGQCLHHSAALPR